MKNIWSLLVYILWFHEYIKGIGVTMNTTLRRDSSEQHFVCLPFVEMQQL
jgi:hypothetical protein